MAVLKVLSWLRMLPPQLVWRARPLYREKGSGDRPIHVSFQWNAISVRTVSHKPTKCTLRRCSSCSWLEMENCYLCGRLLTSTEDKKRRSKLSNPLFQSSLRHFALLVHEVSCEVDVGNCFVCTYRGPECFSFCTPPCCTLPRLLS